MPEKLTFFGQLSKLTERRHYFFFIRSYQILSDKKYIDQSPLNSSGSFD
jgi:hypothetical protein